MRTKTTTALALAGTLLAAPAAALAAAEANDPPSPTEAVLRAPVAGHLTMASQMRAERYANAPDEIRARIGQLERQERRENAPTASPVLEAIAACESGGDPTTDTGNGFYGKYQFTLATWQAVGGTGNPAQASEAEQDRRAAALYEQSGSSPWPVCGR
jgi:hypothetical protein